jgi:hypothetical protein
MPSCLISAIAYSYYVRRRAAPKSPKILIDRQAIISCQITVANELIPKKVPPRICLETVSARDKCKSAVDLYSQIQFVRHHRPSLSRRIKV